MLKEDIQERAEADAMQILNNLTDETQGEEQEDTTGEEPENKMEKEQSEMDEEEPETGQMIIN